MRVAISKEVRLLRPCRGLAMTLLRCAPLADALPGCEDATKRDPLRDAKRSPLRDAKRSPLRGAKRSPLRDAKRDHDDSRST